MNEAQPAAEKVVTRGLIGEFGVVAVLQALSLSRQYTCVELFGEDGLQAGRVLLKSGMVLGAYVPGGTSSGTAAFREIVAKDLRSFQVERLPPPNEYPTPIGRLSAQLLAARAASQRPAAPVRSVMAVEESRPASSRVFAPRVVAPVELAPLDQAAAPGPTSAACVSGEPAAPLERSAQRPPSRPQRAAPHRPSSPAAADGAPIISVASPKGGSGKTTLSLNLAVSLAESGLRVVLVDADPNGDVLSAISARGRATTGLFEAVAGDVDAAQLLLNTAIPNLKVVPAMGPNVPDGIAERLADSTMTRLVFQGLRGGADVVVVDTPAGMFGMTAQILEISTHVIGVLQAESIARRSFSMFQQGLNVLGHRPNVLGVVLNMFRRSHSASLAVLLDAGLDMPDGWLFQTTIPRNDVFLEASESGRPVRFTETDSASVISLLFDTLASEVKDRLALVQSVRPKLQGSFLV